LLANIYMNREFNTTTSILFVDFILSGLMPIVGNMLYFPILKVLFEAWACDYFDESASMYLIADPAVVCWTSTHLQFILSSAVSILLYYPSAIRAVVLAQTMREVDFAYHIVYDPRFLVYEAQLKLLITLTRTFFSTQVWAHLITLAVAISALLILQIVMRPCVSSPKVNLWRGVGYVLVLSSVACSMLSVVLGRHTLAPTIALYSSWFLILIFSVFLHRAWYHSPEVQRKYSRIKKNVGRMTKKNTAFVLLRTSGVLDSVSLEGLRTLYMEYTQLARTIKIIFAWKLGSIISNGSSYPEPCEVYLRQNFFGLFGQAESNL